jgi:YVTN family beta-propeller protein
MLARSGSESAIRALREVFTSMCTGLTRRSSLLAGALGLLMTGIAHAQGGSYVNFETIPTRALDLSPNGQRLFATNTPDGRLEIFNVMADGSLRASGSVSVGLDPIAVAARTDTEVWVVNHLSDSVSIVDVSGTPRVVRTLLVGDEPRDVVFAGPGGNRAFITAARRGQNHPGNTVNETQVPGVGRADVWVFDATNLGNSVGGTPLNIVTLFSDKPGAMGVTPDGSRVFVSVFTSGNETTTINDSAVCANNGIAGGGGGGGIGNTNPAVTRSSQNSGPCALPRGGMAPGGVPGPNQTPMGAQNPRTGVLVKFDRANGAWRDQANRDWRAAVPFSLPDNDVFTIDAMANPPRQIAAFQHVGTLNKSVAVHPTNGRAYVATIEAINLNRFISVPRIGAFPNPSQVGGAARTADPVTGRTLNGHLYESRIAILAPGGGVTSRHLNKHINYEVVPSPPGVKERSVADPVGLAFSPDGSTLFVAALGSNKIVPFQTAQLDNDTFTPNAATHIQLSGDGGPTDLVLNTAGTRMYVYKRFDNTVATIDVAARREMAVTPLFSPEPAEVRVGRKFFYDSLLTSSNGEANCNVCHPSADKDDLAWDLGSPFAGLVRNTNPFVGGLALGSSDPGGPFFNPLKGPMTVLTLRGIKDSGPMFWRGDATTAGAPMDERQNFQNFNIVFEALLGREASLPQADFNAFTNWALTLVPPPNPHRPLNQMLNANQLAGQGVFTNVGTGASGNTDVIFVCNGCHALNPAQGFFGTGGMNSVEGETQFFKVTQLRTNYDKVGAFGQTDGTTGDARTLGGPRGGNIGPQVRGTGSLHDGSTMSPEEFLTAGVFQLTAAELRQVVDFVYAFPTNLAPVVGQQVTLRADNAGAVGPRIDLLRQRAGTAFVMPVNQNRTECDLIAKAVMNGVQRGFLFQPAQNNFLDDRGATLTEAALRGLAQGAGQEVTFTCVYPGGGRRLGIDRDLDGTLDGLEQGAPNPQPPPPPMMGGGNPPQPPPPAPPPPANNGGLLGFILRLLFGGFAAGS